MGGASSSVSFRIPPRLDALLGTASLGNEVRATLTRFHAWLGHAPFALFLFPEYTDHGPEHVNRVLASAEWLIADEAWLHLTPEDAAILVLATLLHDAAMHLPGDGFVALLKDKDRPRIDHFDSQTWAELFEDFCAEARRWDGRKLYRILGDQTKETEEQRDLAAIVGGIREKVKDPELWDMSDRKLLGEFLRRHHARLAHEIAEFGVPAAEKGALGLTGVDPDIANLGGLVARSHNMALRDSFDYFKTLGCKRVRCRGAFPVFLMVLLRIADYLQMGPDRANLTVLKLQKLRSPISQEGWDAHLEVKEIQMPDEEDVEAAQVIAIPDSAGTFLKIRRLLDGLQKELDTSWAVLGEVFSRQDDLRSLGIRLRRVRSNLDDPQAFLRNQKPSYFPMQAAFTTSGGDLLRLLIRPLYGDIPEVGVRELLQNALDAVRELEQLMADRGDPEMKTISRPAQEADVLIDIDQGEDGFLYCTVSDKGIGMTAETVRDYFLKAGASFRTSDTWLRTFAPDGVPRIPRSGRFGIGGLAAFLMGDRIEMQSRNVDSLSVDGVYVEAGLEDFQVSIQRRPRQDVGTSIRVRLLGRPSSLEFWEVDRSLRWDWYRLAKPSVERRLAGALMPQARVNLQEKENPEGLWADFVQVTGLGGVWWDMAIDENSSVNGIAICARGDSRGFGLDWHDKNLPFICPRFDVLEGSAGAPLSLRRDGFEGGIDFIERELSEDLSRELCAFLVALPVETPGEFFRLIDFRELYTKKSWPLSVWAPIWCLPHGFSALHPWNLRASLGRRLFVLSTAVARDDSVLDSAFRLGDCVARRSTWERQFDQFPDSLLKSPTSRRWALRKGFEGELLASYQQKESEESLLASFEYFGQDSPSPPFEFLAAFRDRFLKRKKPGSGNSPAREFFEICTADFSGVRADGALSRVWEEMFGDFVIPYDPAEREKRFPDAFKLLGERIKRWRSPGLSGWRRVLRDSIERRLARLQPPNPP